MPVVNKQTTAAKRVISGSVLDRIQPVSQKLSEGKKLALYGRSGTGKTRLVGTASKKILLIGAEDGTASISTDKGIDFVPLRSSDEMTALTDHCRESKAYNTVALDTGSMLQDLVLKEVTGLEKIPEQKGWGMATQQQYGQASTQTKEYFRALLDLSKVGINVIIICQERNFTEGKDGELLAPSIGSALFPALTGWLHPACDYVCQTFIRRAKVEREVTVAGRKVKQVVDDPKKVEFCLRTGVHEFYATKFRLPRGRELPECIVDPTWAKIINLIDGK